MRQTIICTAVGVLFLSGCQGANHRIDSGWEEDASTDTDGFDAGADQAGDPGSDPGDLPQADQESDAGSDPGGDFNQNGGRGRVIPLDTYLRGLLACHRSIHSLS